MTYGNFSKLALGLILLMLGACRPQPVQQKNPNILIILADQWRAQAFGYAGDQNVKTPHIDSLASVSANFRNAVSGLPVCTPYRASLMTGQRPLTNGVFMNDVRLDTAAVTIAEVLAQNGYQTALIGKWHLDGQYRQAYTPPGSRRQGFQYWKAVDCDHNYNHSVYYFDDDTTRHYWQGYDAIAQAQDAKRYIADHADGSKPFFLMLSWAPRMHLTMPLPKNTRRCITLTRFRCVPMCQRKWLGKCGETWRATMPT